MEDNARIRILQRLRRALKQKTTAPYPEVEDDENIFEPAPEALDLLFAEQFKALGGEFIYCESNEALVAALQQLIKLKGWQQLHCADARILHLLKSNEFDAPINTTTKMTEGSVALTGCMQLLARTGSILFSSVQIEGRRYGIAPDVHIVIAYPNQLVYNIKEALATQLQRFNPLPSMLSLTSGASRTADIEKTLVMGAHGPKELYVFFVDL